MKKLLASLTAGALLLVIVIVAAGMMLTDEEKIPLDKLPKAVVDAVKAKYPVAELVGAVKEDDGGKTIFEVKIKNKGRSLEVSLTPEGKIIEVEGEITAKDLPKSVTAALEAKYPKATIEKIEEVVNGETIEAYEFVIVTAEKKTIEVKFDPNGKFLAEAAAAKANTKTVEDGEEKVALDKLPKAVVDGVKAKFPGAELVSAGKEVEDGKTLYEVAIKNNGQAIEVSLTPEGKIVLIEKTISAKDLPKAVADALEAKYPKATIKLLEEITKEDKSIVYEALIVTADKVTLEVTFDPKGKFIEEEKKESEKD